ncbi:MAG: Hpt domain-containing protein [Burkholderiales bacterium]|nr:Hpt domain-containing protein [Burkholderiales bacterium]MDR4517755.1 Hpt domain-containing protein [Nitrosomonas sp.]
MDATHSGAPSESTPVLNHAQISAIRNLDPANGDKLVKKILQIFLDTSIDLIKQIEDAVINQNAEDLCHAAHSLKSSSANVGAESLSVIAKKMELCGRSCELNQARPLLDNLQQQYQQAATEIKKLLNKA